ncbi:MAG: transposase [Proteobacteria bacterium]|nr:transposase [Pseudomonadota bacterium]
MDIKEKKHRLDRQLYKGTVRVTFTVCTKDKARLFTKDEIVNEFVGRLKISNEKHRIKNWCYIFMPEHIHILNEGTTEISDLLKGMNLFKQYCGYYLSRRYAQPKGCGYPCKGGSRKLQLAKAQAKGCDYHKELQKDYYDHIHRKEDDLRRHIRYLLDNPVRKGLVKRWQDYRFKGSLDYNLEDIAM